MTATVGVCGFSRCGSTMAMTMLTAGGLPACEGSYPGSFEVGDLRSLWETPLDGRAVKLLDSVLYFGVPPAAEWRFLWLNRQPLQQARSQVKFLKYFGFDTGDGAAERFAASYPADRARALGLLRQVGPVVELDYERALRNPVKAANTMAKVWPELDRRAAAAAVHRRGHEVLPDMAVEEALTGAAPAASARRSG